MRWQMGRRSQNIEDRRGLGPVGMGRGAEHGILFRNSEAPAPAASAVLGSSCLP